MGPKHLRGVLPLVVLVISTLPTPPAHAAGTVTVCDEANLRTALSGGGEVTFACSGTIILADRISITSDTTVDGSGQAVTISGNNAVQVFYVETGVTFGLKSLTIANANAKDNTTAGGGAVETWGGTIIIDNSNFTNNTAWSGGAILSEGGTVSVARSTFSNNTAFEESAYGGAIFTESGTLTVSDSTFLGNPEKDFIHHFYFPGELEVINQLLKGTFPDNLLYSSAPDPSCFNNDHLLQPCAGLVFRIFYKIILDKPGTGDNERTGNIRNMRKHLPEETCTGIRLCSFATS